MNTQTQEEVTTVENIRPSQVVRKTTTQRDPLIKEEAPQKVFDKKKRIFRINQIIWYILGFVEVLLAFRIVLKALGANQGSGFTSFIYSITGPLALPFSGILGESLNGNSLIEWSSVFAVVVYLVIAGGLVYLLDLVNPVTQEEVVAAV
ncbi:YggT family protein [Patescibacteria group bacterium]|nr:YggT family protein [Patescibacteria group bacterium]MCL5797875.1 YggT family protein [Patescibacteria group bacterium]